jgi:hypothetical protein
MIIRKCSICGSEPELKVADMGRGNGHGYPGSNGYDMECPKCGMIHVATTDLYDEREDNEDGLAPERIIREWNEKCLEINALLSWRNEIESINPFVKDLLLAFVEGKEEIHLTDYLRAKLVAEIEAL